LPEALIIDGVRSPRGKGKENGGLHHIHPQELLGQVLNSLKDQADFDPAEIDEVVIGNVANAGDHGMVIGRMAVLTAGWPVTTPSYILNRFCGSAQQAVNSAAMGIASGHQQAVVAGGVEMMSRGRASAASRERRGSEKREGGSGGAFDMTAGNSKLSARYPLVPQGISADLIATLNGFTRELCDELAVESQRRAAVSAEEGRPNRSVVAIKNDDGSIALDHDEHPRPGTTMVDLAKLEPSFIKMGAVVMPGFEHSLDDMALSAYPQLKELEHVHHAGNSSGVVDGASAMLIASPDFAQAHGLKPRGKIVMTAALGDEPVVMLTAPAPSALRCLERAGMTKDDIDLWEINEAFAAVVLKAQQELDLDPAIVNVNGGAMALGHPLGATGAMLIETALDELERQDKQTALITMCTGGGMANATIIERV
jgi:acetyl-CoA C-acetyltransferase